MKKIIVTSNKYSFCLDGLQTQMMKYWKEDNLEFVVLGFREPHATLRDNFKFVLTGENMSDATPWRHALNPYFQSLDEDYFFLAFEDHYLVDDVNIDLLNKAENIIKNDPEVGKVRLLPRYNYIDDPRRFYNRLESYDENFFRAPKVAGLHLHSSLRPSIWRKDFFMKLLNTTILGGVTNPHNFETLNNNTVFNETVILPKQTYPIYPDIDAMRGGGPNGQTRTNGVVDMDYYKLTLKSEDVPVFADVRNKWTKR